MKIVKSEFQRAPSGIGSATPTGEIEARPNGYSAVDRSGGETRGLAQFAGVASHQTRGHYAPVYVAPAPQPNVVNAKVEKLSLSEIQTALAEKRIPAMGIAVNGNTISAEGVTLTVTQTATGLDVTASAIGLTAPQVEKALGKIRQLCAMKKTLTAIDKNPNVMADLQVVPQANGKFKILTVARVTVDPRLASQGQHVLDQLSGNHVMPERTRAAVANRARRTQVVG